jgi:hypothetical protein
VSERTPTEKMIELAWLAYTDTVVARQKDRLGSISKLAANRTVDDAVAVVLLCHAAISAEDTKLRSVIIATILVALGEEP